VNKKAARGLRKKRNRAARCGAELELVFGAGGTRLRLKLPRGVLDSDAAAG
jgi:signal transduction histidine kinase